MERTSQWDSILLLLLTMVTAGWRLCVGVEVQTHHPKIVRGPDRTWVVECMECRNDTQSDLPIGIGMPLRDRETAERLRENNALRSTRVAS